MNTVAFISAFFLGLASSIHCLGMCGPLVLAVPFSGKSGSPTFNRILYFTGKAIGYGTLGLIIGLLGFKAIWGQYQQYLSIFAGVLIIIIMISPLFKSVKVKFLFGHTFQKVYQKMREKPKTIYFFILGALNGFLPCGMVYMALPIAFSGGGAIQGFFIMLAFGLGTTPSLFALSIFKNQISGQWQKKLKPLRIILPLLVAVILILRGMNLGIPYLSPKVNTAAEKTEIIDC